jgi:hypothetical protein
LNPTNPRTIEADKGYFDMNRGLSEGGEKIEVSYREPNVEKEIPDWIGRTVKSARVVHAGSEGFLSIEFIDGTVKRYCYNDLAFWDTARDLKSDG